MTPPNLISNSIILVHLFADLHGFSNQNTFCFALTPYQARQMAVPEDRDRLAFHRARFQLALLTELCFSSVPQGFSCQAAPGGYVDPMS